MGNIVQSNLPCVDQVECRSSDARRVYEDGASYCFSCNKRFSKAQTEGAAEGTPRMSSPSPYPSRPRGPETSRYITPEMVRELTIRGFADRGVTKAVCEFYGVKVGYDSNGNIDSHYYPYLNSGGGTSYKRRHVATKEFMWVGAAGDLFGYEKFQGGGKRLIITEGEIDALSAAQASLDKYQKIYPIVSLTSASGVKGLLKHLSWVRSFDEVVLWMDNDEAGKDALEGCLKIVGVDKARIATAPAGCKDANDVLREKGWKEVMTTIWDATTWTPAGIITKETLWEQLQQYNSIASIPYPDCLGGFSGKTKGMRLGEIVLFISGTGAGKSTMLREIKLWLLEHPDVPKTDKLGCVSLEEAPAETARKLAGMKLLRNPAIAEIPIDELKIGFDAVFGDDRVILLDHQGSIADGSIVEQLEYMILMGCKYLFIDHITILVSEGSDGLTGNEAIDKVMNDLLRLAKRHNVWIGLVSHLRKAPVGGKPFEAGKMPSLDDIRGSGSIKQVSFDILAFARDMTSDDDVERNTIKMAVLKCRYTGLTGNCKGAFYVHETGRLVALDAMPADNFTKIT